MADIQDALVNILENSTAVGDVAGDRIYPQILPQSPTYPALTYSRVSKRSVSASGADTNDRESRFQISSWSTSYATAVSLAAAVEEAVKRYMGTSTGVVVQDVYLDNEVDIYDPDVRIRQIAQDFIVWYEE